MAWAFLVGAILTEVGATLALKLASAGRLAWYGAVAVGYTAAFACLALTLRAGLPLGVAYGVWAAAGVALTALLARVVLHEPFTPRMSLGLVLVVAGVLCLELGSR